MNSTANHPTQTAADSPQPPPYSPRKSRISHLPILIAAILAPAFILFLLAVSRQFVSRSQSPDLLVRPIDVVADPAPPPPPPPPSEIPPPSLPPPPIALTDVEALPDLSRVPVAKAEIPMDVRLPVDLFALDTAPAPLPTTTPPRIATRNPSPANHPTPKPAKSIYSIGELDRKPRLLSHPSVSFPAALARRGVRRGTVVLDVELDQRGSVRVRRVISSTHPELVAKARQIAAGSKFTPPTRHGRPVRARMRWPIVIQR